MFQMPQKYSESISKYSKSKDNFYFIIAKKCLK